MTIVLRTKHGRVLGIKAGAALEALRNQWVYIVQRRRRWSERVEPRKQIGVEARQALETIGVSAEHLKSMAAARIVEVSFPKTGTVGWDLPWEHILASATRELRNGKKLLVVRHLNSSRHVSRTPKKLLIINATPGVFEGRFDFESENAIIRTSLHSLTSSLVQGDAANKAELTNAIQKQRPDVIHISAIDAKLGARLANRKTTVFPPGIYLDNGNRAEVLIKPEQLAELFNAGSPRPLLVGLNCWESGLHIAPLVVHKGASIAIGFQEEFDDTVAEMFFLEFYRAWANNDWNQFTAFEEAWAKLKPYRSRLFGSSILFWSSTSIVSHAKKVVRKEQESGEDKHGEAAGEAKKPVELDKTRVRELVHVDVVPVKQINYSLLHNGRNLFEKFHVSFGGTAESPAADRVREIHDIEVEVVLNVGQDSFPYRRLFNIGEATPRVDLTSAENGVHVSLNSALARSIKEPTRTSLYVNVSWIGHSIYKNTFPVNLNPLDAWRLDDVDIWWLASFVQPRDPAVTSIIKLAKRYLAFFQDNRNASFAAYQQGDTTDVDMQVQAIWQTLVADFNLAYIEPPPSFENASQRLRTPSQVIEQGTGTCIDLTILMASCLEWIGVHPVIFMHTDHAFPGYWSSEDAYHRFLGVGGSTNGSGTGGPEIEPWIAKGNTAYKELKPYVDNEELVPLETVNLTSSTSFERGYTQGQKYFSRKGNRKFHSMIDIFGAREAREAVTPLPLIHLD